MARLLVEYYSAALCGNTTALVILPTERDDFLSGGIRRDEDGKIPVMYLLHGMGDDHMGWARYTNLEREALSRGFAVVCPAVHSQSFYSNMAKGLRYFDFIADELPALMREMFPQLSARRDGNYIAGVSMGGYGALKVALSRPERFCQAGCLSSGNFVNFGSLLPPEDQAPEFMFPFYGVARNAFGTHTLEEARGSENDLFALLDCANAEKKELPSFYMYCGTEDFLLPLSDETADYLRAHLPDGQQLVYKKGAGMHHWPFWNQWLPTFFDDCGLTKLLK